MKAWYNNCSSCGLLSSLLSNVQWKIPKGPQGCIVFSKAITGTRVCNSWYRSLPSCMWCVRRVFLSKTQWWVLLLSFFDSFTYPCFQDARNLSFGYIDLQCQNLYSRLVMPDATGFCQIVNPCWAGLSSYCAFFENPKITCFRTGFSPP